mmetsp:Transcript_121374/g.388026  ORF Transcript_121374/g.388026 Transcript_121374/m.388026 type:complete len:225 (+) Transcript_121374:3634-4308(+)
MCLLVEVPGRHQDDLPQGPVDPRQIQLRLQVVVQDAVSRPASVELPPRATFSPQHLLAPARPRAADRRDALPTDALIFRGGGHTTLEIVRRNLIKTTVKFTPEGACRRAGGKLPTLTRMTAAFAFRAVLGASCCRHRSALWGCTPAAATAAAAVAAGGASGGLAALRRRAARGFGATLLDDAAATAAAPVGHLATMQRTLTPPGGCKLVLLRLCEVADAVRVDR